MLRGGTGRGMCAGPAMRKTPPYDPIADFTPVALVGKFGFFVFVHESVPAKSMGELIAYIRNNPGKLNYGTGNSTSILTSAQLKLSERLDIVHIPYKGDGPASADFIAGTIQTLIRTPGTRLPYLNDGRPPAPATPL